MDTTSQMIIYLRNEKPIININLVIHRKDKIFQNLVSTKINYRTKYNLNGKQGHLPICFLNSAYKEMNSNGSNCQNEKK